jgi:YegS/Rv2252/BmrU family lipid kinase
MARKLIFLINPISGTGNKDRIRKMLSGRLNQLGIAYEFHPTNAAGEYAELEKKIRDDGIQDMVVIGGDGSISHSAEALRHLDVNFGIIPTGSGNGLALSAGISLDPLKALDTVIHGTPTPVDAFTINGRFSCMLTGIGFDAKVAHDFARQKKRGLWTYVKVSAMNFFSAREYPFTLEVDGKAIETEAYFISVANSNQFGNNFTIAPKAMLTDGLADVIVVQKMNKLQVLLSVIYQIRFGDVQEDIFKREGILYYRASSLRIHNPSLAPMHIDGDPVETAAVLDVRVIPGAFKLRL